MRLSAKSPTRSQHYRFRRRYLSDYLLGVMHNIMDAAAVEAAQSMGMLAPGLGSLTDPDPRSFVTADGCWVPALTKLTRTDATDPYTGEIVGRYDPRRHLLSRQRRRDPRLGVSQGDGRVPQPPPPRAGGADSPAEVRAQPRSEPERRDHRGGRAARTHGESPVAACGTARLGL